MRTLIFGLTITLLVVACSSTTEDYLIKFYAGEVDDMGAPCGYLNASGDTIVPPGTYAYCYTDTISDFGMVAEAETGRILGIDQRATVLFEVFTYDNGPDYVQSGLFRIIKNGKIGYANPAGKIVIAPQFACAYPFDGEWAEVSDDCKIVPDGEHSVWESDHWYRISKDGTRADK